MNDIDEKIGYLIAKVEEIQSDQKTLVVKVEALEKRVDEKFIAAETTLKVLKYSGLFLVAILTFKFGDVPSLWNKFFG